MNLELDLPEVIKSFRLFSVSDAILKRYGELNEQSFNSLSIRYPNLYQLLSTMNRDDIDQEIANLIYSEKGSYYSIDLLSKLLGIEIRLYSKVGSDYILLNNPEFDPNSKDETPVEISKVTISNLNYDSYLAVQSNLTSVIRELVWYLNPSCDPQILKLEAEFDIDYSNSLYCKVYKIENFIVGE